MNKTIQMDNEVQLLSEKNTKYGFGEETKVLDDGTILHQIVALRDIVIKGEIIARKGEKGGFIEKESNLNYNSGAWVYGDAQVSGKAQVYGDAQVFHYARVFGDAQILGNAWVYGAAWVFGHAQVYGNAWVYGDALVFGHALVFGDARVSGYARVNGTTKMDSGKLEMFDVGSTEELKNLHKKSLTEGLDEAEACKLYFQEKRIAEQLRK